MVTETPFVFQRDRGAGYGARGAGIRGRRGRDGVAG